MKRFGLMLFSIILFECCLAQSPIKTALNLVALDFTEAEIDSMSAAVNSHQGAFKEMRQYKIANNISPALYFNPLPQGCTPAADGGAVSWNLDPRIEMPSVFKDLAFYSVMELASLIKSRKLTSVELTRFCIDRLKEHGKTLECLVTVTEELAIEQATRADKEIQDGKYRGPLHGIPYGAKDLLAVPGYKTTWGAAPFKEQMLGETATVVQKLQDAGAILVAKLSLGALAWGDVWFDGTTKNPWNLEQGSSGSSAGSASATAAGLVPFAIGTETLGSIVSPSTRCHVTGLRPSFGRVSRSGAMALSWSMDKIGPICRNAEDCAVVFDAIRGMDGKDHTLHEADFPYKQDEDVRKMRVGYFENLFSQSNRSHQQDSMAMTALRASGIDLEPVRYDFDMPIGPLRIILNVEAAAAFDELTRSNRDSLLVRQIKRAWPNAFREARLIPAVEYVQANRIRTQLLNAFHELIKDYDAIVTPSFSGSQLLATNLTGHPCIVVPHGFASNGSGTSISIIGNLFEEHKIIALAKHFQSVTEHDEMRPPLFDR